MGAGKRTRVNVQEEKNMSFMDELAAYRLKVARDGKEIVNVPGILALPGVLIAPKMSIIGTVAASLLGCDIHLENEDGKNVKRPTENAEPLGITLEERQGQYKVYHVVVYDRKAQELIIDNMDAILKHKQESITARKTNDHRDEPLVIPDIFPDTEM